MKRFLVMLVVLVAVLATAAQAELLVEYTFENGTITAGGTITDTSGNGHDAVMAGGTYQAGGVMGLEYGFGENGTLTLPGSFGAVNPFDGDSAYTIFMDYNTYDASCVLMSSTQTDGNGDAMNLYVDDGSVMGAGLHYDILGVGELYTGTNSMADSNWHTVRVTYDGSGTFEISLLTDTADWNVINTAPGEGFGVDPYSMDVSSHVVTIGSTFLHPEGTSDPATWFTEIDNIRIYDAVVVPEPATMLLLGLGGLVLRRRRRA